tara:strand:- start:192 stop:467 length:276 start_codon:yes stop_codon:yes gene_type:complete
METQEYKTLYQTEDSHWWYLGLKDLFLSSIGKYADRGKATRIYEYTLPTKKQAAQVVERLRDPNPNAVGGQRRAEPDFTSGLSLTAEVFFC